MHDQYPSLKLMSEQHVLRFVTKLVRILLRIVCIMCIQIRHLDLDAPRLFHGLHEQQVSGLWDQKTVQCSTGQFQAGDYSGWKKWRNSAAPPNQRV